MAGVLYRLGRLCAQRPLLVVAVWLGLVVVVQLLVGRVGAETSNDLSLPGTESQQATDLLADRFPPQQNGSSPVVFHVTKGKITDSANKQAVESSYKALSKVIAAAAIIMISVFGSFILNGDPTIKQFGVGLSVAVLLASTMVLSLAPAMLTLFGRAVWWLPGWLSRLLPHVDIEGETEPPAPKPVGRAMPTTDPPMD
jgi:uncharacterized membrane protein YdfJ with MMPL/SSD domain